MRGFEPVPGLRSNRYASWIGRSLTPQVESQLVWHYTSAEGARGVIVNREFWASSVVTMNDSAEVLYGFDLIREVLANEQATHNAIISGWVRDAFAKVGDYRRTDTYVLSASLDGESQTQFALYGKYALGVNPGIPMTKGVRPDPGDSQLDPQFTLGWRRVLYLEREKEHHLRRLLHILDGLAGMQVERDHNPELYVAAIECIVRTATLLKHERFAHEQEVRLVGQAIETSAYVHFRTRADVIIPYIKIEADMVDRRGAKLLPLRQINIGYGLDFELAKVGLDVLLSQPDGRKHDIEIRNVAGSRR